MKGKTLALALLGGAAIAFICMNGHYVVRYVWLNAGQPMDQWTPLVPQLPEVQKVDWSLNGDSGNWVDMVGMDRAIWKDRLLMLQTYTKNIAPYAQLSEQINRAYCAKKGYLYKSVVSDGPCSDRNPCWDKVNYITKEFEARGIPKAVPLAKSPREPDTWIFWIDSDAAIDDNAKWIESIGNTERVADLYICTSIPLSKNVNTGAMLLRMTPWMHQFLEAWWAWPNTRWHQTMCHEQSALDEMISKDYMGIVSSGKLALFGPTEFNSTYQHGLKMRGKFIQHYRGCSTEKRINAFKNILGVN